MSAQSKLTLKKPYSGVYSKGATGAVHIFDDSQFALLAYATFLTGTYTIKGQNIRFQVTQPENAFVVLGRREPRLPGSTKLTFNTAFAGIPAQIGFDDAPLQRVFSQTTNYVCSQ